MSAPVITLTTDFAEDLFVGVMKGIILGISPEANVVDLTHGIPPGNVRAGAFALMVSCRHFPTGSIHVVVVDPGVGSSRKILCVRTKRYTFLAPDNGILSWVLARQKPLEVRAVENDEYFLDEISMTFHGRDIFAPVAAHLSLGLATEEVGPKMPVDEIVTINFPVPRRERSRRLFGEVVYVDRFGNCITNVGPEDIADMNPHRVWIETSTVGVEGLSGSYADVTRGRPLGVLGSSGFLEIAVAGGSASERFGLKVGDAVTVSPQR
jgi:S-adenosylmethionine hydrolase